MDITGNIDVDERIRAAKELTRVEFSLEDNDAEVTVEALGWSSTTEATHPSESWVTSKEPIVGSTTLLNILQGRKFDRIFPPNKSGQHYRPTFFFPDDNSMITALTQSQVQDFYFVEKSANELAEILLPAYFVPKKDVQEGSVLYAVILRTKEFVIHKDWIRRAGKETKDKARRTGKETGDETLLCG